jgi:HEPN domain-containing protein
MNNDYFSIAEEDYFAARVLLSVERRTYNVVAVLSQQASEKYLKHILTLQSSDFVSMRSDMSDSILSALYGHNIKRLNDILKEFGLFLGVSSEDAKLLTDYYYKTRYPGDGFVEVDKDLAIRCFNAVSRIRSKVLIYLGL